MRPIIPLVAFFLAGCANSLGLAERQGLIRAASIDHGCPADRVEIVAEHQTDKGKRWEVDVCDRMRNYRREGDEFVDVNRKARERDRREQHRDLLDNDGAPPEE